LTDEARLTEQADNARAPETTRTTLLLARIW